MGRSAPGYGRGMGDGLVGLPLKGNFAESELFHVPLAILPPPRVNRPKCLVMFGSGREAAIPRIRDILRWPAPWGNTTANLCATNMFSAAAPAPRPSHISGEPTATFFRPTPNGSSRESDWQRISYENLLPACFICEPVACAGFLSEVIYGLSQIRKSLPSKFLYDEEGSRLFTEICELEEYYPTRIENQILQDNIFEIAGLVGSSCRLVEFGSGTSAKTRHLLTYLAELSSYVPIDISGAQLRESAGQLAREFPHLEICPVEADYCEISKLPGTNRDSDKTVAFFPGSTIGNFEPKEAVGFLRNIASICGIGGGLLVGVDRKKDRRILEPAYNDRKGVTARFNLNILARANRELGADFDLKSFRHHAPYIEALGRIEMRLVSTAPQTVHVDSRNFSIEEGECITTEYSYKYTLPGFAGLASKAGFEVVKSWEDDNQLFSVLFLRVRHLPTAFGNGNGFVEFTSRPGESA